MAQQADSEQSVDVKQRRSRGPTKPFPVLTFQETLSLAKSIMEHGVNGEIQRLTLLSRLNWSPSSSRIRNLITNSSKYGLTNGSYSAHSLAVTDSGQVVVGAERPSQEFSRKGFELAIGQFDPFDKLYAKLQGRRLPEEVVLQDELERFGIPNVDRQKASEVFAANIRYLGLVEEISGQEYVKTIEQLPSVELSNSLADQELASDAPLVEEAPTNTEHRPDTASDPSLHIDVQIHIDSSATPDQIDHIFESMARHLYGRKG